MASLVAEMGFSVLGLHESQLLGSKAQGSTVVAHRLSCSLACEIFPDQALNPCLLHWQADSLPLRHQGSPGLGLLF